jgi:hypothetical protein
MAANQGRAWLLLPTASGMPIPTEIGTHNKLVSQQGNLLRCIQGRMPPLGAF